MASKPKGLTARGQMHSSYTMVDVVITSVGGRVRMAEALRQFAGLAPESLRSEEGARPGSDGIAA